MFSFAFRSSTNGAVGGIGWLAGFISRIHIRIWLRPFRKTAMKTTPRKMIAGISGEEKKAATTRASEKRKSNTDCRERNQPSSANEVKRP
jgi:hypothetical protein